MTEEKKAPDLRFPGFTDPWEQRKLGDLMDVGSVKRVHQSDWRDSGVRFLRARDVVADFNNEEPDDYLYIDQKMYEEYSAQSGKVQQGDLLVTGVGTIGIPMLIKSEKPLYFKDGNIIWFKNKNAIDGQFFYYSFISKGIQDFIKDSAGIGTVGTYTIDSGKKTPINLPTSIEEQKEIGIYFKTLDHFITLHQRKVDDLKVMKNCLLQKLFPKEGENTPELRFPGFTDPWEQRKLSSLFARFDDGDWIEAKDQSSLGVRLVQTGNVGVTEFIDKADNKKWISEETFNRLNCEEIFPGDILISRLPEPAGRACIVPETGTRMITAVDCTIARTSAENSAAFIVQCLSTPGYFKWVNTCLAGGTRQRISRSMLGAYDVMVPPTIGEQKQIGAYFQRLDHLITLHQRKVDDLKTMKKCLLQKMFI